MLKRTLLIGLFLGATFSLSAQESFRTQTQGGWGAKPSGNNPGVYLHANFESAFPEGVQIGGCTERSLIEGACLTFTSAEAITKFLPGGSKATTLDGSYVDPTKKEVRNVLVSQTLAATLSVGFDAYDADFGASQYSLATMTVAAGDFEGKTVEFVIREANVFLAGGESAYTASQLNAALTSINESYVDGEIRSNYLMVSEQTQVAVSNGSSSAQDGKPTTSQEVLEGEQIQLELQKDTFFGN